MSMTTDKPGALIDELMEQQTAFIGTVEAARRALQGEDARALTHAEIVALTNNGNGQTNSWRYGWHWRFSSIAIGR